MNGRVHSLLHVAQAWTKTDARLLFRPDSFDFAKGSLSHTHLSGRNGCCVAIASAYT